MAQSIEYIDLARAWASGAGLTGLFAGTAAFVGAATSAGAEASAGGVASAGAVACAGAGVAGEAVGSWGRNTNSSAAGSTNKSFSIRVSVMPSKSYASWNRKHYRPTDRKSTRLNSSHLGI